MQDKELSEIVDALVSWIRTKTLEAGAKGVVYGLSGGVDSALVGALCQRAFPDTSLALILPCYSLEQDLADARLVAETLQLKTKVIYLDHVFDELKKLLCSDDEKQNRLLLANIKPRLRMIVLYYYAGLLNYLVIGGTNRSEYTVGYFTKHGDGGSDLIPLGNLLKSQVKELAAYLQLPEKIIKKPPSAGLWENQTDEEEMGISYAMLDHYLLGGKVPQDVKEKIEQMKMCSEHKRRTPLIPDF
ncbi:MAG TPA: NAD(+) synthase [Syntrophomonadaceae bacterium]|nr:NAD(+) synthase [Syntrophomonadaceae bacterium]